jgi:capsule polysaccharide export protein KpsE/RkpR
MAEDRSIDILNFFISILKFKKTLIIVAICAFFLSYFFVYFFIEDEYESSAIVVPATSSASSGLGGIMKNLKDLPLGIGGLGSSNESDLFLTIIYSRSNLENILDKFNLMKDYNQPIKEKAVRKLKSYIGAELNDEKALIITARANSPQKAADIANFILDELNRRIIELNVAKSRDNREFLGRRYAEIQNDLKFAEDSLQKYQQSAGILEIKEQSKAILSSYANLEDEYIKKQMELSVMDKMFPAGSPNIANLRLQIDEYKKELDKAKNQGRNDGLSIALNALPQKSKNYIRLFRNVEIYTALLEFITPLYEQAKFDEHKDVPVLQIIDRGSVPEKKIYPPRTLIAGLSTIMLLIIIALILLIKEIFNKSENPRIKLLKQNLSFKALN